MIEQADHYISALKHVHSFVQTFIEMCTEPSFRSYFWLYPGTYQPLQATAILLADLIQCPDSSEASNSRILVDKIFSLRGPDGGVVPEENGRPAQRKLSSTGIEAWTMLRNLRRHAWRKAGRDPRVIWVDARQRGEIEKTNESPTADIKSSMSQSITNDLEAMDTDDNAFVETHHANKASHLTQDDPYSVLLEPDTPTGKYLRDDDVNDGFSNHIMNGFDWDQWDTVLGRSFDYQSDTPTYQL